jgi:hypothetical protein
MSSARNGQDQTYREPSRRLRFDDLASIAARDDPGAGAASSHALLGRGHSGRRFVLVAGLALLLLWGMLYVVFRDWRARYRARALYGASHVVPAIDPLAALAPAGVDPAAWRDAVDQTRTMLTTVTSSNLLDVHDMDRLRAEVDGYVARARQDPETALVVLAEIWNDMADRAEFLFKDNRSKDGDRHPRPKILPPKRDKPRARPSRSAG